MIALTLVLPVKVLGLLVAVDPGIDIAMMDS